MPDICRPEQSTTQATDGERLHAVGASLKIHWGRPAALLTLAAPLLAWADATPSVSVCPSQASTALHYVTAIDGPPDELASLVPEPDAQGRDSLPLAYIYQAGRQVWVHRQYQDRTRRLLQLPEPVRQRHFLPKRRGQAEAQLRCTPAVPVVEHKAG